MNRAGAAALTDELSKGQITLDALPLVLRDARRVEAEAAACRAGLARISTKVSGVRLMPAPDLSELRQTFLRRVGRTRRRLRRRVAWLIWVRFWRAAWFWILIILVVLSLLASVAWVVAHRDWLVERIQTLLAPPETSAPEADQPEDHLPAPLAAPPGGSP
ncbi:MAG: hypothetical protein Q7J57_10085 [Gemmobacter sp.]|nr:hypothetical protein [Gemmobacter sp.]